jgi:uncharacterized OB-fold protein
MSEISAKPAKAPEKPGDEEFVFVDARWDLRQSFRRDALQPAFFQALRERKLLGARDPSNGRVLFPPRAFAEESFSVLSELVPVGPGGIIRTITRLPGGGPNKRPPYCVVFVQLDGADSASAGHFRGAGSDLPNPAELIGKRCHAVFKDEPQGDWADYWYELD